MAQLRRALALLLLGAGRTAQAQQCDLSVLQSHLAEVQAQCCAGAGVSEYAEHLIGYWNFEDGPGSSVVTDASGNGHDGRIIGSRTGPSKYPASSLAGGSYAQSFQGDVSDTVRMEGNAWLPMHRSPRTLTWWVKGYDGDGSLLGWGTKSDCRGYYIGGRGAGQQRVGFDLYSCDGDIEGHDSNYLCERGCQPRGEQTWRMFALTYDGNMHRVYVNGRASWSGTSSRMNTDGGVFSIGGFLGNNGDDGPGGPPRVQLDEVALFDAALSADDIEAIYNDGEGLDLSSGGPGQAECTSGYPAASDTCSRECARSIEPFWQDCGGMLSAAHIGGTDGMAAFQAKCESRPRCDFSLLFEHMMNMDEICCAERGSCASGNPGASDQCSMDCALVFEPFWDDCGTMMIATMGGMMGGMDGMTTFYDTCLTTRYPPGSCTETCSAQTLHCREMEVQNACCGDPGNCPAASVTPLECPVGCALFFPSLMTDCAGSLQATGISANDMAEYRHFSDRCLDQDSRALVEYAEDLVRQGCDIDLTAPPAPPSTGSGRHLQADSTQTMSGLATMLRTNPATCSWDSFDDRVIEMSAICCGASADVTCQNGSPPQACNPECAVFFHSFFEDCGTLLATVMATQIDQFAAFDATCLASADVSFFLSAIQHTTCCITSCKQQLARAPDSTSGVYTMCARDGGENYDVYCEMETDGGGWTMVMNINPVDDNLVGYGQDFWTGEHEYGEWEHHFANDYKSPAAYQLNGPDRYDDDVPTAEDGEIMIQSVAYPDRETDSAFADADIRGWRKWPMLPDYPSFQSMFSTECCLGDNCGNGVHPCKTGRPSGQEVGSTDEWDDIIRRGDCLRTDLRYGGSSGGEAFRLMTYDPVDHNDRMGGFGGATNSGNNLCNSQGIFGQRDNAGMDRILCNRDRQDGCGHGESRVMRNPVTGAREPCQQSPSPEYCTTSSPYHYNDPNSFRPGWTSRFFVREPTALTPQVIAAMEACAAANRYWNGQECIDQPPCDRNNCNNCLDQRSCERAGCPHWFARDPPRGVARCWDQYPPCEQNSAGACADDDCCDPGRASRGEACRPGFTFVGQLMLDSVHDHYPRFYGSCDGAGGTSCCVRGQ